MLNLHILLLHNIRLDSANKEQRFHVSANTEVLEIQVRVDNFLSEESVFIELIEYIADDSFIVLVSINHEYGLMDIEDLPF